MIGKYLSLQWKSFVRSASFGKSLALKLVMGFFGLMALLYVLAMSIGSFYFMQNQFPGQDHVLVISRFILFWFCGEMVLRYMLQRMPAIAVKPFLPLPISRASMAHFLLWRSIGSGYSLLSLALFLPFSVLLIMHGYSALTVVAWFFSMLFISQCLNQLNFLVNKSDRAFFVIAGLLVIIGALWYFDLINPTALSERVFRAFYQRPVFVLIPLLLLLIFYRVNFLALRKRLYLDDAVKAKAETVNTADLAWLERFGDLAPFIQLDLRMIWRNKRPRSQVIMCVPILFYGLLMFSMDTEMLGFGSALTAAFLMIGFPLLTFGQFIPAWDSEHYPMLMSQNSTIHQYLRAKEKLLSLSVVIMFLLTIPYVYFGTHWLLIAFGSALYHLGVSLPLLLFFGSMNKKRIDLSASSFANYQGTGAAQFLVVIPIMAPLLLIWLCKVIFSFNTAVIALCSIGLLGILLRGPLLRWIAKEYQLKKYVMINGFSQKG